MVNDYAKKYKDQTLAQEMSWKYNLVLSLLEETKIYPNIYNWLTSATVRILVANSIT